MGRLFSAKDWGLGAGPGDMEANIMSLDSVSSTSQLLAMRSWSARLLLLSLLFFSVTAPELLMSSITDVVVVEFSVVRLDGFSMNIISSAEHGCMAGANRSRLGKSRSNESPTFNMGSTFALVNRKGILVEGATR